jgi:hypothetical protein
MGIRDVVFEKQSLPPSFLKNVGWIKVLGSFCPRQLNACLPVGRNPPSLYGINIWIFLVDSV